MFPYLEESFTDEEADILRRYVTTLDGPVFALVNLPEVVKGALFARYSRSAKTLRRLFLDEFVGDLELSGDAGVDATIGLRRAEELYDRVFLEYGDDSVAQLGGVHLACEQASNLLTKVLEWGRLMAYLEQSTRYVAYDSRLSTRAVPLLQGPRGARLAVRGPLRGRDGPYVRGLRRASARHAGMADEAIPEDRRETPTSSTGNRSKPRPSTRFAGCCPRRRSRTSGSTAPASPTSSSSSGCAHIRCPRPAVTRR